MPDRERPRKIVLLAPASRKVAASVACVIPTIEAGWIRLSKKKKVHLVKIERSKNLGKKDFQTLLEADAIVVLGFLVTWVRELEVLRGFFRSKAPWVIYSIGESTHGARDYAPLEKFISTGDRFICSSHADERVLNLCYKNLSSRVIPFETTIRHRKKMRSNLKKSHSVRLVYGGRVVAQKNLHTLLLSLRILKNRRPDLDPILHIYGKEYKDGCQATLANAPTYKKALEKFAQLYDLSKNIVWHGDRSHQMFLRELENKGGIFVSASLNIDENFGMAAYEALERGMPAALSHWGGHCELHRLIKNRVKLSPVYHSPLGPFICPYEFSSRILSCMKEKRPIRTKGFRTDPSLSELYDDLFTKNSEKHAPIKRNAHGNALKKAFFTPARIKHPFRSLADPIAQPSFKAFGMQMRSPPFQKSKLYTLVPWVTRARDEYQIEDPHRGSAKLSLMPLKALGKIGLAFPFQ